MKLDSPPQKQSTMTSKEALAVLHKVYDAVGPYLYRKEATQEEQTLRGQVYQAFQLLDIAIHGKQARYLGLCHYCYLRVWKGDILVQAADRPSALPCCTACLSRLQAEHTLARLERWNADAQDWGEVPSC